MLKTNCCHIISGITTLYLIQFVILFILSQRRCCPLYLWNSVMLKKTHWCVVIGLWFFLFPFYAEYFVVAANSKKEWCRLKPVFFVLTGIPFIPVIVTSLRPPHKNSFYLKEEIHSIQTIVKYFLYFSIQISRTNRHFHSSGLYGFILPYVTL